MKNDLKSKRQRFLPDGAYSLEDRALPSSIGHSAVTAPTADVAGQSLVRHAVVDEGKKEAPTAARAANHLARQTAVSPTVRQWSWLANTYWYVPAANLAAVLYNSSTGTVTSVDDQTVFHITNYADGYFWGDVVTQLDSSSPSSSFMVGSVTPQGKVLLTFTETSSNSSPSVTNGYGTMQRKFGQWTMQNQMFTSPEETLQIGHWAYMVQTRLGLRSWDSLPSAGVSVPEFLSEYEGHQQAVRPEWIRGEPRHAGCYVLVGTPMPARLSLRWSR